jgi:hypothetical protein
MGRPPIGKTAMTDAERHRRYMTRLRARAGGNNVSNNVPAVPQLEWVLDDTEDSTITADTESCALYVELPLGPPFDWHVLNDDGDAVAEGAAPSLVAAMVAAEAAARRAAGEHSQRRRRRAHSD